MQDDSQYFQLVRQVNVTPVPVLLEGVFQATARGGKIAFTQIKQHAGSSHAAQEAIVAEFPCQALGFIKPRCGNSVVAFEYCENGSMESSKRHPGLVVERTMDAFALSQ